MKTKIILLHLVLACGLLSCTDFDREEQLRKVDLLVKQVDNLQADLQEHRPDTLVQIRIAISSIEKRIRDNYTADTISVSLGEKMEKFRQLKMFFMAEHEAEEEGNEEAGLDHQTLGSAYVVVNRGITVEKNTLHKLKSDISNGFGKRDKYNEYIAFEKDKVEQLVTLLEDYKSHKDKILSDFVAIYADLDLFASHLEKETAAKTRK
jgi:hypothetical protein